MNLGYWASGTGRSWAKLKGKIRIFVGDMDNSFLNNAVYIMEKFLESKKDPYYDGVVEYGDRYGHSGSGTTANHTPYQG